MSTDENETTDATSADSGIGGDGRSLWLPFHEVVRDLTAPIVDKVAETTSALAARVDRAEEAVEELGGKQDRTARELVAVQKALERTRGDLEAWFSEAGKDAGVRAEVTAMRHQITSVAPSLATLNARMDSMSELVTGLASQVESLVRDSAGRARSELVQRLTLATALLALLAAIAACVLVR